MNLKTGEVNFTRRKRGGWLGIALSFVVIALVASVHWYLYSVKKSLAEERSLLEGEIVLQEKMFLQEDFWQAYDFESRLQLIDFLLKDKSSPTEALNLISKNTLEETNFEGLKVSFEGASIVFECAVTVPSYSSLAKQAEAYRAMENVLAVDFASGMVVEGGVTSTLKIYLKKEVKKEIAEKGDSPAGELNFNIEK